MRVFNSRRAWIAACVSWGLAAISPASFALSSLDDEQMSSVDGTGIAIVLENIRAVMAPTSYIEALGSPPPSSVQPMFNMGNFRWIGLSMTGTGSGIGYNGAGGCGTSDPNTSDLGCPIGVNGIANMAAFDNPYVLRAFSYSGFDMNNNANTPNTVLEFMGPSNMDNYRWAFWGEAIQVSNADAMTLQGFLQSQLIIEGKPATHKFSPQIAGTQNSGSYANPMTGSALRMFQTVTNNITDPNYQVLGLNYISSLSGDFRFSVNQTTASANALGQVPTFDNQEGVVFKNVNAYLPFGQLNYQSLVVNSYGSVSSPNGNFVIELTALPQPPVGADCLNNSNTACGDAYGLLSGDTDGYSTSYNARTVFSGTGPSFGNSVSLTVNNGQAGTYYRTHGYVDWGSYYPGCVAPPGGSCAAAPTASSTSDGMFFISGNNKQDTFTAAANMPNGFDGSYNVTYASYSNPNLSLGNIGTSHFDGLLVQHMKITTCSAAGSSPC